MHGHKSSREVYLARKEEYTKVLATQQRRSSLLGYLRVLVFVGGFGGAIFLFYSNIYGTSAALALLTVVAFLFLMARHEIIKQAMAKTQYLIAINQASLERVEGHWTRFVDDGREYIDTGHRYLVDLDIFGQASVFQWLNTTNTYFGRLAFKETLTNPPHDIGEIRRRQKAVQELADDVAWRQEFQANGKFLLEKKHDPMKLINWMEKGDGLGVTQRLLYRALPIFTTVVLLLVLFAGLRYTFLIPPVLIQALILRAGAKEIHKVFDSTKRYKDALRAYEDLLTMVETTEFTSEYLTGLKLGLVDERGRFASARIRALGRMVELMDLRYNALFYLPLNVLFLWDYQCLMALERWKRESGRYLRRWLEYIGQMEALASLAVLNYDHPEWALPELVEESYLLQASKLGHPLLPDDTRICNDVQLKGAGNILVITGSNMSGKSTLLRTVGLNLVLGYMGARVSADSFRCSLMEVYSSMRLSDNLEQSISSFYAELLRVKMIIEAAKKRIPMLFLLDEIFRGTNSRDRHLGAKTVLRNLSREGAMGLVSTHDLELADLEKEPGLKIKNYHFAETYENGEIRFDYKLKTGVSTTSNAIYLMKMIGIEIG